MPPHLRSYGTAAPLGSHHRGDLVSVAPFGRWDVDDARLIEQQQLPPRFGAFLAGVELFDGEAFGVSPSEAATMDPQQRLLLQVRAGGKLHSFHAARASLSLVQKHAFITLDARTRW